MSIFTDGFFTDIVGWSTGDGLLSTGDNIQMTGSLDVSGVTTIEGDLIANADSIFGNALTDSHEFTGSVTMTGSFTLGTSGSVDGQLRVLATTGSFQKLEKATGTFKIPHPDPNKSDKTLWHSFVESPTAGDNIYRFEIQAFSDNEQVTIDLPEYFRFLNEKPQIFVQALGQFANAYASADQHLKNLRVVCEKKGFYDVLLIATRKDKDAVQAWSGTERDK